jgi:hypothetical protein
MRDVVAGLSVMKRADLTVRMAGLSTDPHDNPSPEVSAGLR